MAYETKVNLAFQKQGEQEEGKIWTVVRGSNISSGRLHQLERAGGVWSKGGEKKEVRRQRSRSARDVSMTARAWKGRVRTAKRSGEEKARSKTSVGRLTGTRD